MLNIQKSYLIFIDSDLPFLSKRIKICKCNKLVCNLDGKKNYVLHIRSLIYGLILQKVHRLIQFNQEAWLKHYIGMIAKLRPEAKNNFKSDIFKLMNNAVFGKTMEIF